MELLLGQEQQERQWVQGLQIPMPLSANWVLQEVITMQLGYPQTTVLTMEG